MVKLLLCRVVYSSFWRNDHATTCVSIHSMGSRLSLKDERRRFRSLKWFVSFNKSVPCHHFHIVRDEWGMVASCCGIAPYSHRICRYSFASVMNGASKFQDQRKLAGNESILWRRIWNNFNHTRYGVGRTVMCHARILVSMVLAESHADWRSIDKLLHDEELQQSHFA